MKDRGLKTRVPFSTTLKKELAPKFDELKARTRINKSLLLDEAIELLLAKYNAN